MKFLVAAAALAAAPAIAQQTPAAATQPPAAAAPIAEVDPERLALARVTAAHIFPDGTYQRVMGGSMDAMMNAMVGSFMDMEVGDMLPAGTEAEQAAEREIAHKTLRELAAAEDPHFEERMRITNKVMMSEMVPVLTRLEPALREGLARAYARKFTAEQLGELNRFFGTPTGRAFGTESMLIWMDPEIMSTFMRAGPDLMKEMPAIMEKVQAATAHLPAPPTKEERAKRSGKSRRTR